MRIVLAAFLVAAGPSLALAQSWTATTGTTQPTTTAPASNTQGIPESRGIEEPKSKIPPSANSQARGIHVGKDAMDAGSIEIKRNK